LNDETIIRFAEVLKASADEILGLTKNDASEGSTSSVRFVRRMQKIAELPEWDQKVILRTLDAYLAGVGSEALKKDDPDTSES